MITTMLTLAAVAQAAVPATPPIAPVAPAVAARPLTALPNTTVGYFDVAGKKNADIKKSLDQILADPARGNSVKLFTWDVSAQILKRTEGQKCTIQRATPKLTARVNLPRLAEQAKVAKPVLANWQAYVATLEAEAAENLWFINDQLPAAEKAVVGLDCAAVGPAWTAAMNKMKTQHAAYVASRAAAKAPAPVAPAAPKN